MNKGELVSKVSDTTKFTQKDVDTMLSAAIAAIMETVGSGEKVVLVGFGSFEPRDRKARIGRNPKSGQEMEIPASTVPAFSAGKAFKDMVANK